MRAVHPVAGAMRRPQQLLRAQSVVESTRRNESRCPRRARCARLAAEWPEPRLGLERAIAPPAGCGGATGAAPERVFVVRDFHANRRRPRRALSSFRVRHQIGRRTN